MRKYELLFPLLEHTTTLDPYFSIAYRFGAIFLSEQYPGGAGRPDQAIALLKKGIAAQPGEVAVPPRHRFRVLLAPSRLRGRGAVVPASGRPAELGQLAETARGWNAQRQQRSRVGQIPVEPDSEVRRGMAEEDRRAQPHSSWMPSTPSTSSRRSSSGSRRHRESSIRGRPWCGVGVLRGIPLDPAGTPFEIDPVTGEVSVSERSTLHPMPDRHLGRPS